MKSIKKNNQIILDEKCNSMIISDMQDSVYLAGKENTILFVNVLDDEWILFDKLFSKLGTKIVPKRYEVPGNFESKEETQKFHDNYVTKLMVKGSDNNDYLVFAKMFDFYVWEFHSEKKDEYAVIRLDTVQDEIGKLFLEFYHQLFTLDEKVHQITLPEYVYRLEHKSIL